MTSYHHAEGKTQLGQLVTFSYQTNKEDDDTEKIIKSALGHILKIEPSNTTRTNVQHGGYGQYSRFHIKQHKYSGGGHGSCGGFTEVLEIKHPPDGRCPFVIHDYSKELHCPNANSTFYEFTSLEHCLSAWKKRWEWNSKAALLKKPGGLYSPSSLWRLITLVLRHGSTSASWRLCFS